MEFDQLISPDHVVITTEDLRSKNKGRNSVLGTTETVVVRAGRIVVDEAPRSPYAEIMNRYEFTVVIETEEQGGFSAYCPALPGCVSQGETYEETVKNIKEAVRGYVKSLF